MQAKISRLLLKSKTSQSLIDIIVFQKDKLALLTVDCYKGTLKVYEMSGLREVGYMDDTVFLETCAIKNIISYPQFISLNLEFNYTRMQRREELFQGNFILRVQSNSIPTTRL